MGLRRRVAVALGAYVSATCAAFLLARQRAAHAAPAHSMPTSDARLLTYSRNAAAYDDDIQLEESAMFMWWFRRRLVGRAVGKVLETSAGTGRNLEYYDAEQCSRIVMADASEPMLKQAILRKKDVLDQKNVVVIPMSSEKIVFPDDTFDTVIDSFGLCSVDNPQAALQEMRRVCKPDGRILLLQHGRTPWFGFDWLNKFLDVRAPHHAQKHGCVWNRDIDELVANSGLSVSMHTRHHFGTTHFIVAAP